MFLAVDKGALTLTLTAFRDIPDPEFAGIAPALQALIDRSGWLWVTWAFAILPLGAALLLWAQIRDGLVPPRQGWPGIVGLLLLMNPDIEIISSTGATLMCVTYLPMGFRILR